MAFGRLQHVTRCRFVLGKKHTILGRDVGNGRGSSAEGREDSMAEDCTEAPQKTKSITCSHSPTSACISRIIEIRILKRCLHSHVHCSIVHNSQDMETTQTSTEQVNAISFRLKRKEILPLATTLMNSEDMLSEISRSQKDKYCTFPHT